MAIRSGGRSILPIKALHFTNEYLLSGEGPNLDVYDIGTHCLLTSSNVFHGANICGIKEGHSADNKIFCAFGNKSLLVFNVLQHGRINILRKKVTMMDWIWDVCCLKSTPGGCTSFALALGHNVIVLWDWMENQIQQVVKCEEKCILYSAHFIGDAWHNLILAAGTVFNQVIFWKPAADLQYENTSESESSDRCVLQRLAGHQGVIFAIAYHPVKRYLCSVSERSIRLWHIEGSTDWSHAEFHLRHVLHAHSSRVWGVRLLERYIVTIGEDATCIVWDYNGNINHKLKGHVGKNICSVAVNSDETLLATGGADCSIHVWVLDNDADASVTAHNMILPNEDGDDFPRNICLMNHCSLVVTTKNGCLQQYSNQQWSCLYEQEDLKSYTVMAGNRNCIAVGNIAGTLRVIENDKYFKVNAYSGKVLSIQWLDIGTLLTTGPEGDLRVWRLNREEESLICTHYFTLPYTRQHWVSAATIVSEYNVLMCGDRGGTVHLYNLEIKEKLPRQSFPRIHGKAGVTDIRYHDNQVFSCGRDGQYRVYRFEDDQLQMIEANKVFKGMEWVARMMFVGGQLWIMGFYSDKFVVYSVSEHQKILSVACGGGHRSWDFLYEDGKVTFAFLRGYDIVLCETIMRLNRHMVLKPSLHGLEVCDVKRVFSINSGSSCVHVLCTAGEDTVMKLLTLTEKHDSWSELHVLSSIQGHISNVRCLAVCQSARSDGSHLLFSAGGRAQLKAWRVCQSTSETGTSAEHELHLKDSASVCGVEDRMSNESIKDRTTITEKETISKLPDLSEQSEICSKLADHPDTDSSDCFTGRFGGKDASRQCWSEYLTTHMLHGGRQRGNSKPWMKAYYNASAETRYMQLCTFAVRDIDCKYPAELYIVAAACSDGIVRLFAFNEKEKQFVLLAHSSFHDHCVLCIKHYILPNKNLDSERSTGQHGPSNNTTYLFSTATDGQVAIWDISSLVEAYCEIVCDTIDMARTEQNSMYKKLEQSLEMEVAVDLTNPVFCLRVHQSGVNCIHVFEDQGCTAGKVDRLLLATGGDDNALSVWCLCPPHEGSTEWKLLYHMSKLDAHSAQITGVKLLNADYLISSSIDQRICLWNINKDKHLNLVSCRFSEVADASALDVWCTKPGVWNAALCGIGLQTFTITL